MKHNYFTVILILLFLLTGCMRQEIAIKIDSDDHSVVTTTVGIKKSIFDEYFDEENGITIGDGTQEWYEYDVEGETYLGISETESFGSLLELETYLKQMVYPEETDNPQKIFDTIRLTKTEGAFSSRYTLHLVTAHVEQSEEEALIEIPGMETSFKLILNIEMPGKLQLNGEAVEGAAHIVVTDFSESKTITVESNNSVLVPMLIGIGGCILVVTLSVLLYRWKKQKDELKQQELFGNDRENF